MKKILSSILMVLLCLAMVLGCGPAEPTPGGGGNGGGTETPEEPTKLSGNLNVYISLNEAEVTAMEAVAQEYSEYQQSLGNEVRVRVSNSTDPEAYRKTMQGKITKGVDEACVVKTGAVSEYYSTDKIVDLAPYLEEKNPYADNKVWTDVLEADAYIAQNERNKVTVPNLSYDTNYLVCFYDKRALGELGLEVPKTWAEFLSCLETAQNSDMNFDHPLALSVSQDSARQTFLGWVISMYLDQYFRDYIDTVHSQEGEYSYISRIDEGWEYDPADLLLGNSSEYTSNLGRMIDSFFNGTDFAPTSPRYADLMRNLYGLMKYIDPAASTGDLFSRFNETAITFNTGSASYNDLKLFYVNRLDYISTYRTAFGVKEDGKTIYPTPAQIDERLGWFALPAMPDNAEVTGGAPAADNLRSLGGPESQLGVLNSNDQSKTDLAVDFLMYLYSPKGQNIRFNKLKNLGAPVTMNQLVKGTTIDPSINLADKVKFTGNCNMNPYLKFGYGYGNDKIKIGSTGNYVSDKVAAEISAYMKGGSPDFSAAGTNIFDFVKQGFVNYAKDQNLTFTDYAKVRELTADFTKSPFAA